MVMVVQHILYIYAKSLVTQWTLHVLLYEEIQGSNPPPITIELSKTLLYIGLFYLGRCKVALSLKMCINISQPSDFFFFFGHLGNSVSLTHLEHLWWQNG